MEKRNFLLILMVLFLTASVFAEFNYVSHNIVSNYSGGDKIKGFFNISFSEEDGDSLFTSNFEGNISLLDFLDANNVESGIDYTCSTANCEQGYSTESQINGFSVQKNTEGKIAGFEISGTGSQPVSIA